MEYGSRVVRQGKCRPSTLNQANTDLFAEKTSEFFEISFFILPRKGFCERLGKLGMIHVYEMLA